MCVLWIHKGYKCILLMLIQNKSVLWIPTLSVVMGGNTNILSIIKPEIQFLILSRLFVNLISQYNSIYRIK